MKKYLLSKEGNFYKNKTLKEAYANVKSNDNSLHIFGLLSDGGGETCAERLSG